MSDSYMAHAKARHSRSDNTLAAPINNLTRELFSVLDHSGTRPVEDPTFERLLFDKSSRHARINGRVRCHFEDC
jgi:hypothetical protein